MKITLFLVISLMLGIWFLQKRNRHYPEMSSEEMLQTLKEGSKRDDLKIALTKVIEVAPKKTQVSLQTPEESSPQQHETNYFSEETSNHERFEKLSQMMGRPEELEKLRKLVRQELSRTFYPKDAKEDAEVANYLADLLSYEFSIQGGSEESIDFIAQTVQKQTGLIREDLIQVISKLDFQNKPQLKDELKRRGIYIEK